MLNIVVSVIIPTFNESEYIDECIKSLLDQDYPMEMMEWLFVDGDSTDDTVKKIEAYRVKYPGQIKVLRNRHRTVPYAMNIGISCSQGNYIIRLDAHSYYERTYISKCIYYLEKTNADNVGGIAETKAKGFIGNCIAKMLSSRFGVGNSAFRTNGKSGPVDTVPFGAFRREVFSKYGGFDERLDRNEDNEINYRIRKNGGVVYLCDDIHFSYYCRNTITGIMKMAKQNGKWNVITMKICPGAMGIRHYIPLIFVFSIIMGGLLGFKSILFWYLLLAELILYFLLDVLFTLQKSRRIKEMIILLALFPMFHVSYGIGSIIGLCKLFSKEFVSDDYAPPKI